MFDSAVTAEEALTVACPKCHAKVGAPCVYDDDTKRRATTHRDRLVARRRVKAAKGGRKR